MKKVIFILAGFLMCIPMFAQFDVDNENYIRRNKLDSLDVSEIVGPDTTIYIPLKDWEGASVTFDFTSFDAYNDTLYIGASDDTYGFTLYSLISSATGTFPLDSATWTNAEYSATVRLRIPIEKDSWRFPYMCFNLTNSQASTGILYWLIKKK